VYSDKVKIHHIRPISPYDVSTVRASEKSSIIANRKSTTRFPTSYRQSPYVTPNSPKGRLKKANLSFKNQLSYISVIAEVRDFIFGKQLGFAKFHHQILPEQNGCGPGLRELPKILGSPFNISATAEASDLKFVTQLGFAKTHQTHGFG